MNDLISRQAAIDAICKEGTRLERNGTVAMCEIKQWCIDLLEQLPSAQPERKKGKWINAYPDIEPNPMFMYGICSVCGYEQAISDKLKFCPNCGADMRGEQNG